MDVAVGPTVETVVLARVKREVDVAVAGGGGASIVAQLVDRRRDAERTDLGEGIFVRNSAFSSLLRVCCYCCCCLVGLREL